MPSLLPPGLHIIPAVNLGRQVLLVCSGIIPYIITQTARHKYRMTDVVTNGNLLYSHLHILMLTSETNQTRDILLYPNERKKKQSRLLGQMMHNTTFETNQDSAEERELLVQDGAQLTALMSSGRTLSCSLKVF
jgi:hypothetical protein